MDHAEMKLALQQFIITEILSEQTNELRGDDPLISGGRITSFSLARIATFMESTYGIEVADNDLTLEYFDTLDRMAAFVTRQKDSAL